MLKKTMTYTDYSGNERTEDFYFNLTKAEVLEMDLAKSGGMEAYLKKIVAAINNEEIVDTFKTIIQMSYGEKSDDGKRFIKNKELTEAFTQTEAYSDLFFELATNADSAVAFINGIIPNIPKPIPEDK